jgi:hypothetical protein
MTTTTDANESPRGAKPIPLCDSGYGGGGVVEKCVATGQRSVWKLMRAQVFGYPLRPDGLGLLADHVAPQQFAALTGLGSLAGPFRTLLHPA